MKTLTELRFERTSSMNLKIIKRDCLENVNNIIWFLQGCHKLTVYALTRIKIKKRLIFKKSVSFKKRKSQ